jgi:hypothetical protein
MSDFRCFRMNNFLCACNVQIFTDAQTKEFEQIPLLVTTTEISLFSLLWSDAREVVEEELLYLGSGGALGHGR